MYDHLATLSVVVSSAGKVLCCALPCCCNRACGVAGSIWVFCTVIDFWPCYVVSGIQVCVLRGSFSMLSNCLYTMTILFACVHDMCVCTHWLVP